MLSAKVAALALSGQVVRRQNKSATGSDSMVIAAPPSLLARSQLSRPRTRKQPHGKVIATWCKGLRSRDKNRSLRLSPCQGIGGDPQRRRIESGNFELMVERQRRED